MSDPNLEIASLSSRICALEKSNRRWKIGGLVLFFFLMAAALLTGFKVYAQRSAPTHIANAVAAHEFLLMGPRGEPRGRIGVIDGKPELQFYNEAGKLWWYAPPKMGVVPVKVK